MKLTEENYYTQESDKEFLSYSQYKLFNGTPVNRGCEARAMAILNREYVLPENEAMLVGRYVDAYFDGEEAFQFYKDTHPEIISSRGPSRGQLKSEYQMANVMIDRATRDRMFMQYMAGEHQKIMVGEINGVPFKIKIDSFDGRRITDLKTCESLTKTYYTLDGHRCSFVEAMGYDIQAAVYQEIVRQNTGEVLPYYIAAVSKDKNYGTPHPRIAVIEVEPTRMQEILEEVKQGVERIQDLKRGLFEPIPCKCCEWCADHINLDSVIGVEDLMLV